jgi:peptide-methionine (S)-S-oxide reductase
MRLATGLLALALLGAAACTNGKEPERPKVSEMPAEKDLGQATLGGGCFWCVEAVFDRLDGVTSVTSGYAGGTVENPTYEQVCAGDTGHAEVCRITYDTSKVSFDVILEVFFQTHDPTTLNRQGNDVGPMYRSIILYHDEAQKKAAEEIVKALEDSGAFANPIVTEIAPLTTYYAAEKYHQDYYELNPAQGYCSFVIRPKVEKFEKVFKDRLKK